MSLFEFMFPRAGTACWTGLLADYGPGNLVTNSSGWISRGRLAPPVPPFQVLVLMAVVMVSSYSHRLLVQPRNSTTNLRGLKLLCRMTTMPLKVPSIRASFTSSSMDTSHSAMPFIEKRSPCPAARAWRDCMYVCSNFCASVSEI